MTSTILSTKCPSCGKKFESDHEVHLRGIVVQVGKCGHLIHSSELAQRAPESIVSLDKKKLYPFQNDGVRFIEQSSARVLIADEMGLGKTVQALATIALHPEELTPFIVVAKSSLKIQWQHEIIRWLGPSGISQIVDDSKTPFLPGFLAYIVSYDLLPRLIKKNGASSLRLGAKLLILDEIQQIKNNDANRTIAVRALSKEVEHIIALSGTPIKNRASEYFPILNILHPEIFPTFSAFQMKWCDSYFDGYRWRSGGLANPKEFQKKTKSFIIRRERAEVMPDLPAIDRHFSFHELSKQVEAAYQETFKQFRNDYNVNNEGFEAASNILAYLSKMRYLTGLSKVDPCIDFCMEFLGSNERKLTIFVHHQDVGEMLLQKLLHVMKELELERPLRITSDLSGEKRAEVVNEFTKNPKCRILIASTLASGEGINLQVCSDCIILERQWNPANEEQAEGRFSRIGQLAESITATYFLAIGTVDEFFSEIVERKREIVNSVYNGSSAAWDQSSLIKELAEVLAQKGGERWRI